jgi:hypothetical protein
MQETMARHPQCFDVLFSMWAAYKGGNPPVWVPAAPEIRRRGSEATPWSAASGAERSRCLSLFSEITGVSALPSAAHKAADARHELFW